MKLQDLSIGHNRAIVSGIDAELTPGVFACLTGRNGTGKSTLLRTLAGLLKPIAGTIELNNRPLRDFSPAELARRIGLVLTHVPDLPNTTLREMVVYGRLPYATWLGRRTAADWAAADDAIRTLGIAHLAHRRIGELSDGERQKTMIARALAQGTDYLLLDEPSAFLDYESKLELMEMLRHLAHDCGKAILLSSHDLELVRRSADTIWHIADGRLSTTDNR
ncbi:MAG: ABC transporter ATP-binding protein [Bacteroidales bacterium]|jgi:iron complex transport system ATP-binding protein|nr:ABC transporter ATP-binding protein [Bacteroidales bacterium]